ncbi:DUF362 domain-containing protein [Verrucomicrobiota bacterium]
MKTKVWFTPLKQGESAEKVARKVVKLANSAGLSKVVSKDGLIGILQHMGEGKGIGYIKPRVTNALAARIRKLGAKPFLTGSTTLYRGRRTNAYDHIVQAYEHGFTPSGINCPIIMCDGLRGSDRVNVKVPNARHCRTAYVGSGAALMQGLVVLTHPTGHPGAGFAASIKNVSMGLASRGGKLAMHHGSHPDFLAEKCTACGKCAQWCPENAIVVKERARIIVKKCVGCGQCYAVCPLNAIDFKWNFRGPGFQERLVEYCAAVKSLLGEKILCVNIIQHFQKGCDCLRVKQKAICPDVGIVVSHDIVAVDQATADLLIRATGKDIAQEAGEIDYRKMLLYAEKLGLGSRKYRLIEF